MARRSPKRIRRMGAVSLLVLALAMAASFNLQKFPGFRGTHFHAEFSDASGLRIGNIVEIAGMRVGRVNDVRIDGNKVIVDFDVHKAELGKDTRASVQVLNLLGEKYLQLDPVGAGEMGANSTIPLDRTSSGYDIVSTLGELTNTSEQINKPQLRNALTTLATTLDKASPEVQSSFDGLSRLSQTISSRNDNISTLLARSTRVTKLLDDRKGDLVKLMKDGDLVFQELIKRREAIHALLVNAQSLAVQLRGVAQDNQKEIGPALRELDTTLRFLNKRQKLLGDTIKYYGPYSQILINIIGTGPWFDASVPNLTGLVTGEFKSGKRAGLN